MYREGAGGVASKPAKPRSAPTSISLHPKVLPIWEATAQHFGISIGALLSRDRTSTPAAARQVSMALIREFTDLSFPKIGKLFGRDHTTVKHACDKIAIEGHLKRNAEKVKRLLAGVV